MKRQVPFITDCQGSGVVITVVLMFVFVGFLAFMIDLAHLITAKTELQNAGDACALRGARAFLPDNLSTTGYTEVDPDPNNARTQAQITIQVNRSDNTTFQNPETDLPLGDIEVGIWDYVNRTMLAWEWPPPVSMWGQYIGPGVRLPTRRTDAVSLGEVGSDRIPNARMIMARIFGFSSVPVHASATAALSGVGELREGYPGSFPIAVDEDKVHAAGDIIFMSPDDPDVGGWTSLSEEPASASEFKGLINHTIDNPPVWIDKWINLQNGVACSAIKEAIKYYNTVEESKGVYRLVPPIEVCFPVVQVDKFNQTAQVKGFMAATIDYFRDSNAPKDIEIPGTSIVTGDCMLILTAIEGNAGGLPGGGRWYGLLSTEPKLVQ